MSIQNQIEQVLQDALAPTFVEVINESANHNVPEGSESHFKVTLVCAAFAGEKRISRHRMINKLLAEFLAGSVHALALHVYTIEEWQEKNQASPESPDCRGGLAPN